MEYCEGGELFDYIVKNRYLSEYEAAFYYYQLICGLEYIHSLGIKGFILFFSYIQINIYFIYFNK